MNPCRQNILLTGATGLLGSHIHTSGHFPSLLVPKRKDLNLCSRSSVKKYFTGHEFDTVIHAAASARIGDCERNRIQALEINIMGTCRLVEETIRKEKQNGKPIRFIHISTDGVYASESGRYKESDATIPYNCYGWTKLGAESAVHMLSDYCIVRTRFFDPNKINFDTSARDSYSSTVPVNEIVEAIRILVHCDFIGTVNVGHGRHSDFSCYKKYRPDIRACVLKDIQKTVPFKLSSDASMDCRLWRKIKCQNQ